MFGSKIEFISINFVLEQLLIVRNQHTKTTTNKYLVHQLTFLEHLKV
jgi:hypothetical protein